MALSRVTRCFSRREASWATTEPVKLVAPVLLAGRERLANAVGHQGAVKDVVALQAAEQDAAVLQEVVKAVAAHRVVARAADVRKVAVQREAAGHKAARAVSVHKPPNRPNTLPGNAA